MLEPLEAPCCAVLRRCWATSLDPVRFLARLAGRDVDRHIYFRRLLLGALRGPPGAARPVPTSSPNTMNYYGTRGQGHDLAFHSELRDALFASGLPFVVSVNDVPKARELYSRADSIASAGLTVGSSCCWPPVVSAGAGGLAPVGFKQLAPTPLPLFSS